MNPTMFRGLAALCLLCVLPRLGAVPSVIQTASFSYWGLGMGDGRLGGWGRGSFDFQKWDNPQSLGSLTIDVSWTSQVRSWEHNPFTDPPRTLFASPFISSSISVVLAQTPNKFSDVWQGPSTYNQASSPDVVTVQPKETVMFSGDFTGTQHLVLTDPDVLAALTGNSLGQFFLVDRIMGFGSWGGVGVTGNATVKLTFQVPEHGNTFALFLGALVGFALLRRRDHVATGSQVCRR